jgi:hypothetical protein
VRKAFNALTRECYEDGAPTSAHVGLEMIQNDRFLTTQLRRTIFNQGFPIAHPLALGVSNRWWMPPVIDHFTTPGTINGKLVITAKIPKQARLAVKIWTTSQPRYAVNQGEAEDRFRGGSTYDLIGTGGEYTYTMGWVDGQEGEWEILFPLASGTVEGVQFGFRSFSRGVAGDGHVPIVSSVVSSISEDGTTITVQAGALAALPVQLPGYTFDLYDDANDRVIIWGREALSCDQDDKFTPVDRIWDQRLINGIDAKADVYLRIYGTAELEVYSIAAFEHVRREVP